MCRTDIRLLLSFVLIVGVYTFAQRIDIITQTKQGPTVAFKPKANDNLCYASPNGNDTNDGLSWGTAKLTIYGCIVALPVGSVGPPAIAGHGTIYFSNLTPAHPTASCGVWIMGTTDPNYASPPACWIKQGISGNSASLSFIGIEVGNYGPNPHAPRASIAGGSTSDRTHPGLWLSGTNAGMHFTNVQFEGQGRPVVLGEDSTGNRGSNLGGVSGLTFVNVGAQPTQTAGLGPAWDISGVSFELYWHDCGGTGTDSVNSPSDTKAAAFLFDGSSGHGQGAIVMTGTNVFGGGVQYIPGDQIGTISIQDILSEGQHGTSALVWFPSSAHNGTVVDANITGPIIADNIGTVYAVENDTPNTHVACISCFQLQANLGPVVLVNSDPLGNITASPLSQGQRGIINQGRLVGRTDAARRQFGPVSVRFANLASIPGSANGGTITTGVTAPDGTTGAITLTSSGGNASANFYSASIGSPAVGTYYIGGVWVRATTAGGYFHSTGPADFSLTGTNTITSGSGGQCAPPYMGDGEWEFVTCIGKLTASSSSGTLAFTARADSGTTTSFYGPMFLSIAPSIISNDETWEVFNNLQSYSSTCTIGTLCGLSGQTIFVNHIGTPLSTPVASSDACTAGTIWGDASFVYFCTASGVIKRAALSAF